MGVNSDLLHAAYMGDITTLPELQQLLGFTVGQSAQACFVSEETYRRWLADRRPSKSAVRIMAMLAGYLPWPGWDGWVMDGGYLFPPGFTKHGVSPGQIHAHVFQRQLLTEYQRRHAELEKELESLKAAHQMLIEQKITERRHRPHRWRL
jgi:hypothetical protein